MTRDMQPLLADEELVAWGQATLAAEAQALEGAAARVGPAFAAAARAVLAAKGKVVVTGLGKSGHVGRKIASTLSSTGTSAFSSTRRKPCTATSA